MGKFIHKILYRTLPLEGYLRAVSRLFFLWQRLGIGREAPATEYVYHLPKLVRAGDTCIDIGANLGYYARTISRLAGPAGKVYAVEPVAPIRKVLSRNLRRCANTEILPYALGLSLIHIWPPSWFPFPSKRLPGHSCPTKPAYTGNRRRSRPYLRN